jgi:secreted trypsin-like serine protease
MSARSLGRGLLAFAATVLAGLALSLPTAGAAPGLAQPFIVGGHDATQTYSFMASMQTTDGQHNCGASLIDKQWLVTAAHCVVDQEPSKFQYRIGTTDLTSGGELATPDKFVVNPKYDPQNTGDYDIALVHLAKPVQAAPIKIAGTSPQPGTEVREIGWGLTCPVRGCGEPPQKLQELDTKVVDAAQCTSKDSPFDGDRELCMDNHGGQASACYGDSGGPAVVHDGDGFALVGATSRGQTASCPEKPGIYTNVVAHVDWIKQTLGSGAGS